MMGANSFVEKLLAQQRIRKVATFLLVLGCYLFMCQTLFPEGRQLRRLPEEVKPLVPVPPHPVSIVVPSWSRMDTLPNLLAHLLLLDSMQHPASEILVSHVSQESREHRDKIHSETKRILKKSMRRQSSIETVSSKLIHLDFVDLNAKWGCAARHMAALEAKNDVLVHLDDDLMPSSEAIATMIQHVSNESGFPHYSHNASGGSYSFPQFYGNTLRYCGPWGYFYPSKAKRIPEIFASPPENHFVLTNFAAMSSHLNQQFVSDFQENQFYQRAMNKFKGNGCDLIFNHWYVYQARTHQAHTRDTAAGSELGGVLDHSLKVEQIEVNGYKGLYGGSSHSIIRNETCRCLFTNFTLDCLDGIPHGETPK